MRKVGFPFEILQKPGDTSWSYLPSLLVVCREGICQGTQAMCQLMRRDVVRILCIMRTHRMGSLMLSKTPFADWTGSWVPLLSRLKNPPTPSRIKETILYVHTPVGYRMAVCPHSK